MTLAAPLGLLALAVVGLLVLAHLRRRRVTREVASLLLWAEDERAATPRRRRAVLVLPLLLVLQALGVVALAVALARPEHERGAAAPRPVEVFVVDTSVAMRPADRLRAARAEVDARLSALPAGTRAALVVGPRVAVAPTGDRGRIRSALADVAAGYSAADLATAVRVAGGLLATARDHVVVLHAREDAVPETTGVAVTARALGAPLEDQAVEDAVARCAPAAPADCRLHATVRNDAGRARTDVVEVRDGARVLVRQSVRVAAHARTGIILRVPAGARLRVAIAGAGDGLPEDDAASVVVPAPRAAAVTLVSDAGRTAPLARALAAVPGAKLRLLTPAAYRRAGAGTTDVLVLDRVAADRASRGVPSVIEVAASGAALADASITTTADSELLAGVDLTGLAIDAGAAHRLTPPAALRPVVSAAGGPLLAAGTQNGQRVATLTFDPRRSTLPGLAAFPALVANLVAWGRGTTPEPQTAGNALSITLPSGTSATVTGPGTLHDGTVALDRPGFITVAEHGAWGSRTETIAVNAATPGAAAPASPIALRPAAKATGRGHADRWRWLVALALVILVLEASVARRALGLRLAAAAVLVVALLGPHAGGERARHVVLVVDRSASGGRAVAAAEDRWIGAAQRGKACPCRVVGFGTKDATDLVAALDTGAGLLPDGGRLVVLGDGVPTTGDAAAAASRARARGIQVDGVELQQARGTDAAVVRVHGPSAVRAGDPFTLALTVRSSAAATVRLSVAADGGAAAEQRVKVRAGDTAFTLDETAGREGWHRYRVAVALAGDENAANDALDAVVRVAAAPRVLVVGRAGALPAALRATGAKVSVGALPKDASALRSQDAVVLADVGARDVDGEQAAALTTAVRSGGLGLLALGGEHSLSLGGGAGSPLDALLPTRSIEPGGLRRSLALELVLDRSSSMADLAGTTPKIALAQQAARAALGVVRTDQDELGVVAFDAKAHTIVPRQRVATDGDAADVAGLLDGLDADGGTSIQAGLDAGLADLAGSRAPAKHIILLSDGVSEKVDEAQVLARVRRAGATLSTVALGADADRPLLRRLAKLGGGRFIDAPDGATLPKVFADEAKRAVPSVAARGRLAVTPSAPSSLTASLADRALPALGGVVVTELRPGATAPLVSRVQGRVVPVLAQWQTGLGRAVTWTPGVGAWAGRWLADDARVLTDAVRWVQRAVPALPLQPALAPGEPLRAVIDPLAAGGAAVDLAAPAAPGLTFTQDAPSHYAAALPAAARAQVDVLDVRTDGGAPQRTLLAIPYPAEAVPATAGGSVLGQLAELTGGRLLGAADPHALAPGDGTALWPFLVVLALALIVAAAFTDAARSAAR